MKLLLSVIGITLAIPILFGCSGSQRYHKEILPEPSAYNAHFGDMDANGDDQVVWKEFKEYFPDAKTNVFQAIDINKDEGVDHDEWHQFKEAHGMKH